MNILKISPEVIKVSSLAPSRTSSMSSGIISDLSTEAKAAALEAIRSVLTEENTDRLIKMTTEELNKVLPFWARWLPIGTVLDRLLPETLLKVFERLLR